MSKVKEKDILKALGELEDLAMNKSDKLESADTEGGFSTEGKPLSGKAPSGRGDAMKSDKKKKGMSKAESVSDMGSDDDSEDTEKALPPADDGSSDDAGSDDESGDDESGDDGSGDDDAMSKSLRASAAGDETMRKAIEVSDFLEGLVDQTSDALTRIEKSIARKLRSSIAESASTQGAFNVRLARGVVALGNLVKSQVDQISQLTEMVQSFANAPTAPRGRAMLNKSDVQPAPIGDEHADTVRKSLNPEAVIDWLIAKGVDPLLVTRFETSRYDVNSLPPDVKKALVHDLVK